MGLDQKYIAQFEEQNEKVITSDEIFGEQSMRDPLTGLLNDRALSKEIAFIYHDQRIDGVKSLTFTFIDMDGLKSVNDRWGHDKGDEYIASFTGIIKTKFRDQDKIYRIKGTTGDEIGILINGDQTEMISAKLEELRREQLDFPFSYGIAIGTRDVNGNIDLRKIINQADFAMIEDKTARKNSIK